MVVGVVSDTHGNVQGMRRLADKLKARGVSTVLHVGDDYRDLNTLQEMGLEVMGVPGVYCREYADPDVPNRLVLELGGLKLLLTHTEDRNRYDGPGDPDPRVLAREVQIVLFGHTHAPVMEDRQGVLWLNPGHLKDRRDRGHPSSFGLLTLSPAEVGVEIRRLEDDGLVLSGVHRTGAKHSRPG
jgi:uncharacterized protein